MTTTQTSMQDQLDRLLVAAAGRFGRQVRMIACADPELAPVRSATVTRMRERMEQRGYRVDTSIVASAILDRVLHQQAV